MQKHIEAPEIAKQHGMTRLVFDDDFDSLDTIDLGATGKAGYKWYVRRPYKSTTMTFLWEDDLFVGYFDGKEVLRMEYGADRLCNPLPLLGVGEQMKGAFSFMNKQELALIINGSLHNPMEIDWIRVWQK